MELASPSVALHLPLPEEVPGSEGLKDIVFVYRAAFPDLTLTIDDMVAEGDKVAVRFTTKGTNTGPFIEVPPTGKRITMTYIEIFRIADGKIIEIWGEADLLGLMQQLGTAAPRL